MFSQLILLHVELGERSIRGRFEKALCSVPP